MQSVRLVYASRSLPSSELCTSTPLRFSCTFDLIPLSLAWLRASADWSTFYLEYMGYVGKPSRACEPCRNRRTKVRRLLMPSRHSMVLTPLKVQSGKATLWSVHPQVRNMHIQGPDRPCFSKRKRQCCSKSRVRSIFC